MRFEQDSQNEQEDLYSVSVRAGKRTYFFDVKSTKNKELYITVSESKKKMRNDGTFYYEKHKIFLFQEDFDKFQEGLLQASEFVIKNNPPKPENSTNDNENNIDGNAYNPFSNVQFDDLGS